MSDFLILVAMMMAVLGSAVLLTMLDPVFGQRSTFREVMSALFLKDKL